jgi:peptidoglycan/LPS O-acetylase OafA/YrhL
MHRPGGSGQNEGSPFICIFLGDPLAEWSSYLVILPALLNLRDAGGRGPVFRWFAYLGRISNGLYFYHGFMIGLVSWPLALWFVPPR